MSCYPGVSQEQNKSLAGGRAGPVVCGAGGGEGAGRGRHGPQDGVGAELGSQLPLYLAIRDTEALHLPAWLKTPVCFFQMPKTQTSWAGIRSHTSFPSMSHPSLFCRYPLSLPRAGPEWTGWEPPLMKEQQHAGSQATFWIHVHSHGPHMGLLTMGLIFNPIWQLRPREVNEHTGTQLKKAGI